MVKSCKCRRSSSFILRSWVYCCKGFYDKSSVSKVATLLRDGKDFQLMSDLRMLKAASKTALLTRRMPGNCAVRDVMGLWFGKVGDVDTTLETCKQALAICETKYGRGAEIQSRRLKTLLCRYDAILDVRKALEIQKRILEPNDPELYDNLGLVVWLGNTIKNAPTW